MMALYRNWRRNLELPAQDRAAPRRLIERPLLARIPPLQITRAPASTGQKGQQAPPSESYLVKKCPVCPNVVMMRFNDPTTKLEIDTCPECLGLWFDGEEMKLFFESPNVYKAVLTEDALSGVAMEPAHEKAEKATRMCPACSDSRLFPSTLGKTQVDYCLGCHGIWFDSRELEDLVTAFRAGASGNLLIVNQLAEGLGTASNPNPRAQDFLEALERYHRTQSLEPGSTD